MALRDITVPLAPSTPVWPGDVPVGFEPNQRIANGAFANTSKVTISSHGGTHVDAPWHFIDDGKRLSDIPLDRWNGPCVVIRVPDSCELIGVAELEAAGIPAGTERLLIRSRNSERWVDPGHTFWKEFTAISPEGAQWIVDHGIRMVGIDYHSVEPYTSTEFRTHLILLGADMVILETIDLRGVEPGPYWLHCMPLNLTGSDGSPARAALSPLPLGS